MDEPQVSRAGDRRFARLALAVVFVVFVELFLVARLHDRGVFTKYPYFAEAINQGRIPTDRLLDLSPGYLWSMVLLTRLGWRLPWFSTLQVLDLGAAAIACGWLARRMAGEAAGWVAAAAILLNRAALVNAVELEPDATILLLNALAVAFLLWAPLRRNRIASGLLFGASMAFRPLGLLPCAAMAAWLVHQARQSRQPILATLAPYALPAAIPLILVAGINFHLTGSLVVMNPGTVFYEGMNPMATGFTYVAPQSVIGVERTLTEPDAIHVAYRIVAERSLNRSVSRAETARYWTAEAMAFVRTYPMAAARLFTWKAWCTFASYDVYDLVTMRRKDVALRTLPLFVPYGLLAGLALVAAIRDLRRVLPLVLYVAATSIVMPVFYVSARHRNAVLPGMAVLAGCGIAAILTDLASEKRTLGLAMILVALASGAALSHPFNTIREDVHQWDLAESDAGRPSALGDPRDPATRFDDALGLIAAGHDDEAKRILEELRLARYRPARGVWVASSVSYHHARACLHLHQDGAARADLAMARNEAQGDVHVLSLEMVMRQRRGDANGAAQIQGEIDRLHDPFSAAHARALALHDVGDDAAAFAVAEAASHGLPEWPELATLAKLFSARKPSGPHP